MGESDIIQLTEEQTQEILEAQIIHVNKAYIEKLKKILEVIDKLEKKPNKDRLGYTNILAQLIGVMIESIKGWQNWLNFNSMDVLLTLDELEEIIPKMKEMVKKWIEFDISITEAKTKDVEKQHKETKAKIKIKTSKQYVS